jgi:hypothetical protein
MCSASATAEQNQGEAKIDVAPFPRCVGRLIHRYFFSSAFRPTFQKNWFAIRSCFSHRQKIAKARRKTPGSGQVPA